MATRETKTFAVVLTVLLIGAGLFLWWDWKRHEPPAVEEPAPPQIDAPVARGQQEQQPERRPDLQRRRCAHCGETITGSFAKRDDRYLHRRCLVELDAPRCGFCEEPIVAARTVRDRWGNVYHAEHRDTPPCEYCGRMVAKGLGNAPGRTYEDGRRICGICRESAIDDLERAEALKVEVAQQMAELGLVVTEDWIRLHLVDREELALRSKHGHERTRGVTVFKEADRGMDVLKRLNRNVYILHGMPELDTRAILAHELTHVWQGELRKLQGDPAFIEGSCNQTAVELLGRYDDDYARYLVDAMLADTDRVYGEGLRRVGRYVEEQGRQAWIDRMREDSRFPEGY